ncbi:DUF4139 domain-containing protein [Profundibacter sp.]
MRHILTTSFLCLLPATAMADDFTAPLRATQATVYPQGANVTYHAMVDLTAGSHRILLPYQAAEYGESAPQIKVVDGVRIGAINYLTGVTYDQDALLNSEQRAAKQALEAAEDAVQAGEVDIRQLQLKLAALETQTGFLGSISGAEMGAVDVAQLRAVSEMILAESEAAIAKRLTLEAGLRKMADAQQERIDAHARAKRDFSRLSPPTGSGDMMAITVDVASPVAADFEIKRTIREARWSVDYDFRLTYGDAPTLNVERKVIVIQDTGQAWSNIDLILSTASPFSQAAPSDAGQNRAWMEKPMPVGKLSRTQSLALPMMEDEVVYVEEAVMADDGFMAATSALKGLSLRYIYPRKVTLETGKQAQLTLDSFDLPVETSLLAIPRRDETAFVMAAITNDTSEPLLPGAATFYRDGDFIGRDSIDMIPAGGTHDLAFGSMEGIRLTYTSLRHETGDSGIIATTNTREDTVEFSVENLTGKQQDVRTLFALPYSEQEDLVLSTRIRPNPSETDVDDIRGVAAWDMQIGAGQTQKTRVTTTLDWPKGFDLYWYP